MGRLEAGVMGLRDGDGKREARKPIKWQGWDLGQCSSLRELARTGVLRFLGWPLSQGDGASCHNWGSGTGLETKPEVRPGSGLTNV